MKLLLYSHDWCPIVGGVSTVTRLLAEGLAAYRGTSPEQPNDRFDVTLVTQTAAGGMHDSSFPFRVVRQPSTADLIRLIKQADLIHLAGPALAPLFLSWLLRKPAVVEHHGFQSACPNGQLVFQPNNSPCPGHFMAGRHVECVRCNQNLGIAKSVRLWGLVFARRWLLRRIAANIAPTNLLTGVLELPRATVIYHGLSVPEDRICNANADMSLTFAYVGRLVGAKGITLLLEAVRQLKDEGRMFQLDLIGEGPERYRLEQTARELDLKDFVRFHGYVPDGEIGTYLQNTTAVVLPSVGGEVFSLVAAENMFRGCTVIVPYGGAPAEVVGDTGVCFTPGDSRSLANAMRFCLEEPQRIREMGRTARKRALQLFREGQMIAEHVRVYTKVIESR